MSDARLPPAVQAQLDALRRETWPGLAPALKDALDELTLAYFSGPLSATDADHQLAFRVLRAYLAALRVKPLPDVPIREDASLRAADTRGDNPLSRAAQAVVEQWHAFGHAYGEDALIAAVEQAMRKGAGG